MTENIATLDTARRRKTQPVLLSRSRQVSKQFPLTLEPLLRNAISNKCTDALQVSKKGHTEGKKWGELMKTSHVAHIQQEFLNIYGIHYFLISSILINIHYFPPLISKT